MALRGEDYDQKIIEMEFDNAAFEQNIRQSMKSIDSLQDKLDSLRGGNAFEQIAAAAADMGFEKVVSGIDSIDKKMSAMGVVGATVINRLTSDFMNFGKRLWSMTLGQASSGGMRRALNIQQAEFLMEGLKLDVQQLKEDAMFAVEDTAYGFDEAASAAAQFGVAGVKAGEEMKKALLGVSGVAAMTGRDYSSIAHIFTTIASQGRVMGMQLTQLSYAGINASEILAKHLNTTSANVTKMVSQGKISFKQFAEAMNEAFGEHAKDANKTFTGNLSNIKAALSRIGAEFAGPLTTDFIPAMGKLRDFINKIKTDLGPIIQTFQTMSKVVAKLSENALDYLQNSKAFSNVFQGLENIFYGFLGVTIAVSQAFKKMFPQFDGITDAFRRITVYLIPTQEAFENIKARAEIFFWWLFKTVNKIILIGKVVVRVWVLWALTFGRISEAIVDFIASHVDLNNLMNNFKNILKGVIGFIALAVQKILEFKSAMSEASDNPELSNFLSSLVGMFKAVFGFIKTLVEKFIAIIPGAISKIESLLGSVFGVKEKMDEFAKSNEFIMKTLGKLGELVSFVTDFFNKMSSDMKLGIVGIIASLFALGAAFVFIYERIKVLYTPAKNLIKTATTIPETIKGAFSAIQKTAVQFTRVLGMTELEVYSQLLMRFALSVGVLALSLKLLSTININDMITGLAGLATIVFLLYSAMQGFYAMGRTFSEGGDGSVKGGLLDSARAFTWMSSLMALMTMFTAMVGVITLIAHLDPSALAQATLTTALLVAFIGALSLIPIALTKADVDSTDMIKFSLAMVGISAALGVIVGSFALLAHTAHNAPEAIDSATTMLIALAGGIIAIMYVQNKANKGDANKALSMAGSFALMAVGIVAIAEVLRRIAKIGKPKSIIAAGLALSAVAIALASVTDVMNATDIADAGAFAILAVSLVALAGALAILNRVDWDKLLVGGGALTLLGLALAGITKVMNATDILDAVSLAVLATSLITLAFSLKLLADINPVNLIASVVALGSLVAILVAVSLLGTEVTPVLWAIGAAILGLGLYMVSFGLAIKAVSEGIAIYVGALKSLSEMSSESVQKIIENAKLLIVGLADVAKVFVEMSPYFVDAVFAFGYMIGMAIAVIGYTLAQTAVACMIKIGELLEEHLPELLNIFGNILVIITDWLVEHETQIEDLAYNLGRIIGVGVSKGVADGMLDGVEKLANENKFITPLLGPINGALKGKKILGMLDGTEEFDVSPFLGPLDDILTAIDTKDLYYSGKEQANQLVNGLEDGIEERVQGFWGSLKNLAQGGIDAFNDAAGIESPSKVMHSSGEYLMQGLSLGVRDGEGEFIDQMGETAEAGIDATNDKFDEATQESLDKVNSYLESYGATKDTEASLISNALTGTKELAEETKEAGEAVRQSGISISAGAGKLENSGEQLERAGTSLTVGAGMLEDTSDMVVNTGLNITAGVGILEDAGETIEESGVRLSVGAGVLEDSGMSIAKASDNLATGANALADAGSTLEETDDYLARIGENSFERFNESRNQQLTALKESAASVQAASVELAVTTAETIDESGNIAEAAAAAEGFDIIKNFDNAIALAASGSSATEVVDALLSGVGDVFSNGAKSIFGKSSINNAIATFTGETSKNWEEEGMKYVAGKYAYELAGFKTLEDYVAEMENRERRSWIDDLLDDFLNLGDDADKLKEEFADATGDLGGFADSAGKASKATDKLKDSVKSALDVFSEFNDQVGTTGRSVLQNFMNQITGVSKWSEELKALSTKGLNANFLLELAEKGPQAYDQIHALYTMTNSELTLFNQMYAQKLSLQKNAAKDIRNSFIKNGAMTEKAAAEYGKNTAEAVARGVESSGDTITSSMTKTEERAAKDAAEELQRQKIDDAFISQWANGVASNSAKLTMSQAFTDLGLASMDAFKQSMNFEVILDQLIVFKNGIKDQVRSALNLFDEVAYKTDEQKKAEEKSTQQMLYNMTENAKKIGRWATNIQRLSERGLAEGLVDQLRQLGPEGADTIDAFVRMSDKELKKANAVYASSLKLDEYTSDKITSAYSKAGFATSLGLKKGLDEGKDDLLFAYQEVGEDASQGFVNGVDPNAANEVMMFLGENSLSALKTALDSHSPSKETEKIGMDATEGYILGIEAPSRLAEAMSKLATTTLGMFTQMLGPDKFRLMGIECIDNFARGMIDALQTKTHDILSMFSLSMLGINENLRDPENSFRVNIIPVVDQGALDGTASLMDRYLGNKRFDISATVNRANATNRTNPTNEQSPIVEAIRGLREDIRNIRTVNEGYRTEMGSLREAITSMKVTLDTGALVGQITNPLDAALGMKAMRQQRRRG